MTNNTNDTLPTWDEIMANLADEMARYDALGVMLDALAENK
jgi:hypothetical protein